VGVSSTTTELTLIPVPYYIFVVHFNSWGCLESNLRFISPCCCTAHVWGDVEGSSDGL